MSVGTLLIILLVVFLFIALANGGTWGYLPGSGIAVVLVVLLLLVLLGYV